jgi:hypothetical protein
MPPGGPFITDAGYSVALSDGSTVTGAQIAQDIHDWLAAGAANHQSLTVCKLNTLLYGGASLRTGQSRSTRTERPAEQNP